MLTLVQIPKKIFKRKRGMNISTCFRRAEMATSWEIKPFVSGGPSSWTDSARGRSIRLNSLWNKDRRSSMSTWTHWRTIQKRWDATSLIASEILAAATGWGRSSLIPSEEQETIKEWCGLCLNLLNRSGKHRGCSSKQVHTVMGIYFFSNKG